MKTLKTLLDETREKTWRAALEAAGGNISEAAATAGVPRRTAMRLMERYDLTLWAAELRRRQGNKDRGRPYHSKTK
jgi:DNA-binding NtrC family response regulator